MKKNLDFEDFSIRLKYTSETYNCDTTEKYQTVFLGRIMKNCFETDKQTIIGRFEFSVIKLEEAINGGENIYILFDELDLNWCSHIIDENDHIINEKYSDYCSVILEIKRIEIKNKYRGLGIGEFAIRDIINRFGDHGKLVVVKPYPLQYEAKIGKEVSNVGFKKAKAKVVKFYKGIGFKPGGEGIMYIDTSCNY